MRLALLLLFPNVSCALTLWLDLRGTPSANGLDALLALYTGVRKRFADRRLPPPQGAAVAGVLHNHRDLKGDDDPNDGGLALLTVRQDGSVWSEERRVGVAISAGSGAEANSAAHAAVRLPESDLVLLAAKRRDGKALQALFEFALAQAQHCRGISGSETRILCECRDEAMLTMLQDAERADEAGVPLAAILPRDAQLWFDALSSVPWSTGA